MSKFILVSIGSCLFLACGAAHDDSLASQVSELAPARFLDWAGVAYVRRQKANISTGPVIGDKPEVQETTGPNGERLLTSPPRAPEVDPETLSVEELAGRMRGRTVRDGYEYEEEELPVERARKIKERRTRSTESFTPAYGTIGSPAEEDNQRYILGADTRVYAGGNRTLHGQSVWLKGCGCTGSMIGSRIAATAAHCIYNHGQWCVPQAIVPAADNGSNSAPFGEFTDFTITISIAWNGIDMWGNDYARIVFNSRRGDSTGWLGAIDAPSGTMEFVGYPGDKPYPQLWLRGGQVTSVVNNRLKHNLDTAGGDSGSGLYRTATRQLVGIHSTENFSQSCFAWICGSKTYWNEATRFSPSTWAFFEASGVWPD
jgi:V8-like Glu-specific endopeptidase